MIRKSWISPGLLKCIEKRNVLHTKARKNPDDLSIQLEYKNYRNFCNNILQNLKNEHDRNLIRETKGNSGKMWRAILDVTDLKKMHGDNSELMKCSQDPTASLNKVNNYFSTVGRDLANGILNELNTTEQELAKNVRLNHSKLNSFFMTPTDEFEIKRIISTLKVTSAPGPDNISNKILIMAKHILAAPLAFLCNLSMATGIVPDSLKEANVCPIFKSKDKKEITNYRPISLLNCLSKIIEKVVNKRLLGYLEKEQLLADNQFGFRPGRSTEDAVVSLVDFVGGKLDEGKKCIGVFLDLAKAFDTVSRPILFKKLESVGVRGIALDWFKSYLSNRKQRVKIKDCLSEFAEVTFGVPQGSVLGPTLFLVYINDLCQLSLPNAKIVTFADDTAIVFHDSSWKSVHKTAQLGLQHIFNHLKHNLLTLNISKTNYIRFTIKHNQAYLSSQSSSIKVHSSCNPNLPPHSCSCPILEHVSCVKYLGVLIDSKLTWIDHIKLMCSRLRKLFYIFKKLKAVADSEVIRIVYSSLCQSLLYYCIVTWGAACKTYLLKVERLQRSVLKVAYSKPFRYRTSLLYTDCKLLTVRQLFVLSVALRYHKTASKSIKTSKKPQRYLKWATPKTKTKFAHNFFPFIGPLVYGRVNNILDIVWSTRHIAKTKITRWLLTLDYANTENLLVIVK